MSSRPRLFSLTDHIGVWGSGFFALGSAVGVADGHPDGILGVVLGCGGSAFIVYERLFWRAEVAVVLAGDAGRRIARHDIAGYHRWLEAVKPLRKRRAAEALVELSGCPRLLDGLFFHARRREIRGFPEAGGEPLHWALASLHPDGYVRADAVAAMSRAPLPESVPFLVERAVERVDAVRSTALEVLRVMLAEDSARVPIARSFARVAGRQRAGALAGLLGDGQPVGRWVDARSYGLR